MCPGGRAWAGFPEMSAGGGRRRGGGARYRTRAGPAAGQPRPEQAARHQHPRAAAWPPPARDGDRPVGLGGLRAYQLYFLAFYRETKARRETKQLVLNLQTPLPNFGDVSRPVGTRDWELVLGSKPEQQVAKGSAAAAAAPGSRSQPGPAARWSTWAREALPSCSPWIALSTMKQQPPGASSLECSSPSVLVQVAR